MKNNLTLTRQLAQSLLPVGCSPIIANGTELALYWRYLDVSRRLSSKTSHPRLSKEFKILSSLMGSVAFRISKASTDFSGLQSLHRRVLERAVAWFNKRYPVEAAILARPKR